MREFKDSSFFLLLTITFVLFFVHSHSLAETDKDEFATENKKIIVGKQYPELVLIPAGSFEMGEQDTDFVSNISSEIYQFFGIPNKIVDLKQSFYLGKYEITYGQYNYYLIQTGKSKKEFLLPSIEDYSNYPIVDITWQESMEYANWLGEQTGRECRLPTEAEWEYAARAESKTTYQWGDNLGANNANCKGCGSHWDNQQPAPVGSFAANAFGLHDMSGNVWEWTCSDWQDELKGQEQRCSTADMPIVTVRGGSWQSEGDQMRSAARGVNHPLDPSDYHGFRVMCMNPRG